MMNTLDSLKGLPLVELFLDGNPIKKRIRDEQYVRYIAFNSALSRGVT